MICFLSRTQVKKAAAETEQAWKDAGSKVGLQIWRIVKFKVKQNSLFSHTDFIIIAAVVTLVLCG